jgi:hypothetical protein
MTGAVKCLPPERRRGHLRLRAAAIALVLALGGCAGPAVIGGLPGAALPPVATDGAPVDPALGQTLATAGAGATFSYRLAGGGAGVFVLGPLYQSGRGVPCRIGRLSPAEVAGVNLNAYPFCRFGDQWYAMRPVVVSGY